MKILITGGAGYIGSHMIKLLREEKHEITTLENLSTGYRDAICAGNLLKEVC
jgi:UDP-glucose 4-epimerase